MIIMNLSYDKWRKLNLGNVFVLGRVSDGRGWLSEKDISKLFLTPQTAEEWVCILERMNGFFAIFRMVDDRLVAAVDRIRSIPLFYGVSDGVTYFGDNAEWVRQRIGDDQTDPVSREEFELTGYVTGSETLYPNVRQLQAGEVLLIDEKNGMPVLKTYRYYRFLHNRTEQTRESQLRERLDIVANNSVRRLAEYANGRQIVIPLSGGYDSRLIATLLKRIHYDNVLTFTYGTLGNRESACSQRVAHSLNYPWHFVEYSREKWRMAWNTEARRQYSRWASGLSSLPHLQDWLAVREMQKQRCIHNDCVFAPGHSGDFVAGSHIPSEVFVATTGNRDSMAEMIFRNHYNIQPIKTSFESESKGNWLKRILDRCEANLILTPFDMANYFEKWDWQERQAKYIVNSVRVYEFFGYDWWLPLWDSEFISFWQDVPLELRKGRRWYINYVEHEFNSQRCDHRQSSPENYGGDWLFMLQRILKILLPNFIKSISRPPRRIYHELKNPLGFEGQYPTGSGWCWLILRGYQSNGVNAKFFLSEIENHN